MNYPEKGSKAYLYSIVLVAVLGGLLFGYDTAVISGAEKGLQAYFIGAKDFVYSDVLHGITCSSALLGCIIGSRVEIKENVFVAQLVEQLTLNQWVQGSSPCKDTFFIAILAQLVEQLIRNE